MPEVKCTSINTYIRTVYYVSNTVAAKQTQTFTNFTHLINMINHNQNRNRRKQRVVKTNIHNTRCGKNRPKRWYKEQ